MKSTFQRHRRHLLALAASAPLASAPAAWSQAAPAWPTRPLRMMVGYPAGSGIDAAARALARHLEAALGQTILVDNRAGALGNLAAQAVASAAGDDHTLLFTPNSTHAANVHLFRKLPFDPVRDFTPIGSVATLGFVLVGDPNALKVDGIRELLEQIRREPQRFVYGSGNATGLVAGSMFKTMVGVDLLGIPYKGVPPALNDLLGGRLQLVFADAALAIPMIKGGRIKAYAVTSRERMSALPDVPTLAESGLAGYDLTGWFAVFMPARTPPAVAANLSTVLQRVLREPELVTFLRGIGVEPQPSTPAELARRVQVDTEKWGRLVKQAGIEPE